MGFYKKQDTCPHCNSILEERKKTELTKKDLTKQWFYTKFIKCPDCDYIKLNADDRIFVRKDIKRYLK